MFIKHVMFRVQLRVVQRVTAHPRREQSPRRIFRRDPSLHSALYKPWQATRSPG